VHSAATVSNPPVVFLGLEPFPTEATPDLSGLPSFVGGSVYPVPVFEL
jgi:hypothetical protein